MTNKNDRAKYHTDWDKVEYYQNPPESGKSKNAKGGNDRTRNKRRYDENFDKIDWSKKRDG